MWYSFVFVCRPGLPLQFHGHCVGTWVSAYAYVLQISVTHSVITCCFCFFSCSLDPDQVSSCSLLLSPNEQGSTQIQISIVITCSPAHKSTSGRWKKIYSCSSPMNMIMMADSLLLAIYELTDDVLNLSHCIFICIMC